MNPDKRIIIDDLTARVNASPFLIVVDYTSITVPEFTNLRSALAACGAQCCGSSNAGKFPRPECLFHSVHLAAIIIAQLLTKRKHVIMGKLFPE